MVGGGDEGGGGGRGGEALTYTPNTSPPPHPLTYTDPTVDTSTSPMEDTHIHPLIHAGPQLAAIVQVATRASINPVLQSWYPAIHRRLEAIGGDHRTFVSPIQEREEETYTTNLAAVSCFLAIF